MNAFRSALTTVWLVAGLTMGSAMASPPLDENCAVLSTGDFITNRLTADMRGALDEQARDVMGIFDMSCLSNIIKFGGLNWFGLDGWLDGLQGALCTRVRDWIEGDAAVWDGWRHPAPLQLALRRDAARHNDGRA